MKIVLIIASVFMILGCADDSTKGPTKSVSRGSIELVTLTDGTNCAVFSGHKKGGLSCNWKN